MGQAAKAVECSLEGASFGRRGIPPGLEVAPQYGGGVGVLGYQFGNVGTEVAVCF